MMATEVTGLVRYVTPIRRVLEECGKGGRSLLLDGRRRRGHRDEEKRKQPEQTFHGRDPSGF